ncbi:hypothetical protein [Chryseolinea lacunae]|uniref:Uncharacterized protein n=1 Tax=Chryseolinea lacunae TaxID=2801331 RepID=A0ABS1KVX8_9BACT|nr:hypothetical protein [Chryseolinea lacunae]MBL0743605.1 hypothetical protein [Chryseolinea lacunae]
MEDIKQTRWTDDAIADLILKVRNDLLKDFLDDRFLKDYVGQQFKMRDLSAVKVEFIRKDLKELFATPIDRAHYEPIISSIRESDTASLSDGNEQFFYAEVEKILKRHIYG